MTSFSLFESDYCHILRLSRKLLRLQMNRRSPTLSHSVLTLQRSLHVTEDIFCFDISLAWKSNMSFGDIGGVIVTDHPPKCTFELLFLVHLKKKGLSWCVCNWHPCNGKSFLHGNLHKTIKPAHEDVWSSFETLNLRTLKLTKADWTDWKRAWFASPSPFLIPDWFSWLCST